MILGIKFEIQKDYFNSNKIFCYWIIKKLILFNRVIYSHKIYSFFDEKEGIIPFLIEERAKEYVRILNMKKDEQFLPFYNHNYFILKNKDHFSIIKEDFIFNCSLSYTEIKEGKNYSEIVEEFNNILDKEYFK